MDIGNIIDSVNGKKIGKAIVRIIEATMPVIIASAIAEADSQTGTEIQNPQMGFTPVPNNEQIITERR